MQPDPAGASERERHSVDGQNWPVAAVSAVLLLVLYAGIAWPVLGTAQATAFAFWLPAAVLAGALIAVSAVDITTFRLPDILTLPLAAAGIAIAAELEWDPWWLRLAAAVTGYAALTLVAMVYRRARGRDGLGQGDAKLLAAAGAWVGLEAIASVVLWAAGLAVVLLLAIRFMGYRLTATTAIPFGPFLALGTWIVWLYGPVFQ